MRRASRVSTVVRPRSGRTAAAGPASQAPVASQAMLVSDVCGPREHSASRHLMTTQNYGSGWLIDPNRAVSLWSALRVTAVSHPLPCRSN